MNYSIDEIYFKEDSADLQIRANRCLLIFYKKY